ncbi:MAG TPA: branched-chain amino acid ABC transporter permease [Polyangiaceae bacterium]|jgi:branched-chain amino acid transport system permease protein|nr:branched-chain amino acid ABC transporter permease [Polyangiaceae bacterium]
MTKHELYAFGGLAVAALGLSGLLDDSSLSIYVLFALTATVTVGVSLLMGQAGQVSLGHGAFYACGAYAAGVLTTRGFPSVVGLLVAPLAAAALAAVIGVPLLVLRGHHLAFATLATHLIVLSTIGELTITGGDVGLQGIPRLRLASFELDSVRSYAYLSSFALLAVVAAARNVLASRPGRALRALSSSEIAASSAGVPVGRYKLAVFALSAGFAGLAGGIYAFYMGYLAPGSFPVLLSIEYVVMAVVGGLGTISGAVVGSALVLLLVHVLSRLATMSGMPETAPVILSYAVYAVLLITAVLFLPGGVCGSLARRGPTR